MSKLKVGMAKENSTRAKRHANYLTFQKSFNIRVSTLKDFFLFKEIYAISREKRKYEIKGIMKEILKKLEKIEKNLISANVTLCNYLCHHKYSV